MKLRLDGKSIRLRLAASELSELDRQGRVSTETLFPDGRTFTVRLELAEVSVPSPAFDGDALVVRLPGGAAREWLRTEQVGIYDRAGALRLEIEKDLRVCGTEQTASGGRMVS